MRFPGSREGLEPNQLGIVDEEFRWTDENGTEHRVPIPLDIRRQAISSFEDKTVYTVTESDSVAAGDAHVAFVTELSGGQTIYIENLTCVSAEPYPLPDSYDVGPDGLALAENMAVLLIHLDGSDPNNSNVEMTVAQSDGGNPIIQSPSSSSNVNRAGVYMVVLDWWHFQQPPEQDSSGEPSILDTFKAAISFRVWWE